MRGAGQRKCIVDYRVDPVVADRDDAEIRKQYGITVNDDQNVNNSVPSPVDQLCQLSGMADFLRCHIERPKPVQMQANEAKRINGG